MAAQARGEQDVATVDKDGRSVAAVIDGVKTRTVPNHVDHRGNVFELWQGDNQTDGFFEDPFVYAYQFSVAPHQIKGWGLHERKVDRYSIISGERHTFLWDDRDGSPTRGVVQRVVLSERASTQLIIPTGAWHLNLNVHATDDARLNNFPTEVYHHHAPDRRLLAWDDPSVPIRIADLLPKF